MKISEYSVKNYQFTLVIFLMVVALGVSTLLTMPRAEDPDMNTPIFPVIIIYPGASPEDMEELVVDPIEKQLSELEDIKELKSSIGDGVALLRVELKHGKDVDDSYQEIVREINTIREELPQDIYSIEVQKVLPSNVNILQIGLVSENASRDQLRLYAEKLQDHLESLSELKDIKIHGLPDRNVRVDLQLEKMAGMRIPLQAVLGSLQSEIANIPGGSIEAGTKSFNIKTSGNYRTLEEISDTWVYSVNGKNIALKDIATIYFDHSEDKHITRLNGHRTVLVTACQKIGLNISSTKEKYDPVLAAFEKELPANIDMVKHFDQADNVNKRLGLLGKDFLIAILLVSITLLPLGFRAAFVVMISIPLSLAIGLVLLNLLGYNLNQLSIVGLVVALGLLVDDSIVVVENIERWLREGYSRYDATIKATQQIGLAVVGCTATLVIAFMPLVFMPEASGDFIRSLPMAIILCVIASMLVSLTIIPFLSSIILKQHAGSTEGNIFLQTLQKGIHKTYAPVLDRALKHPYIAILVALIIFGASLSLFPVIGFSLFPPSEKPQFVIDITTPIQTNITTTNEVAKRIEAEVGKYPEVKYYTINVGAGNPRIYYNEIPASDRTDYAQIFVQLQENSSVVVKNDVVERMRKQFAAFPEAKVEVKNFEQGPPIIAPVEVRIYGENLDTLKSIAAQVEQLLLNTEGAIYVNNPISHLKTDIKVDINKDKASMLGVSIVDIDRTVRMAIAGLKLGKFNDENSNEYDILVSTPGKEKATLEVFDNLYVNSRSGAAIPIRQLAELRFESSPLTIRHSNKKRTTSLTTYVQKGKLNEEVINDVIKKMDAFPLPKGYTYDMGGEFESKQKSFDGFGVVILVTAFMFIAVLILEFKTFKSTLIVLSVIPLGIVGAVLALWITGNAMSFVAIVGLIALAGIEVKNSILLVDFTNQLRQEGKSVEEAIREAGEIRFLPIILTSFTAIGGLIPIAISTNPLISPLAIVLIGGLISSTLLSRVVTPVIYKLIPPKVEVLTKTEDQ